VGEAAKNARDRNDLGKEWLGVLLTQSGLIENLAKHGIIGIKTSMLLSQHYFSTITETDTPCDKMKHQQIVGELLHLSRMTRPKASMQVNPLGRRSTNPSHYEYGRSKGLATVFSINQDGGGLSSISHSWLSSLPCPYGNILPSPLSLFFFFSLILFNYLTPNPLIFI
jgi:hypothetical protein